MLLCICYGNVVDVTKKLIERGNFKKAGYVKNKKGRKRPYKTSQTMLMIKSP